ncbi:class I SAM-dependent methyltransferase, partial [Candidatus Thorarchaeota archaeon]
MVYDSRRLDKLREGYEKAAEFYNLFASNDDLPFYLDYAERKGSPILDLAAGAGRVSIELAKHGYRVTAVEKSIAMINEFRKNLVSLESEISDRITLVEADMTGFASEDEFSLAVIPASFGHAMTTNEQLAILRNVHSCLQNNGFFILDLFPGGLQPEYSTFSEPPKELPDGRTVNRSGVMKANPVTQILELKLKYTVREKSGEVVQEIIQDSGTAL